MKTLIREVIARIPGLRFWVARRIFLGPGHNTHRFWGVFPNIEAARAHIPRNFTTGFDAPNLEKNIDLTIHERDNEVVRILGSLMPLKRLFDLGGNVGMSFYQYRTKIAYPPDFTWTVCDVPYVNVESRRIAAERGETQLLFTDHQEDAEGADVYLTAGALQYFDVPFSEILGKLKHPPPHVIVNRVPLTDKSDFWTLQHMGYSIVPYHLGNRDEFIASITKLGYELAESWKNNRFCDIILRPDRFVPNYHGFYFRKPGA